MRSWLHKPHGNPMRGASKGMPILQNPRHERFAQELANGKSGNDAYVAAGFKANRGNAGALTRQQHISTRVAELLAARETVESKGLERAIERTAITKERALAELAKLGFSNMEDYTRLEPNGERVIDLSACSRDHMAAVQELVVEDFKDGRGDLARNVRRIKFRLADKRAALVDIGKHLGMFVEQHHHTGDIGITVTHQVAIEALLGAFSRVEAPSLEAEFEEVERDAD